MSEDKKTHDEVRIKPSIESLRMAVDMANGTGHAWTAECIVRSAALFDAYLSGLIRFSVHDCDSLDNGFYNLLLGRIEGLGGTAGDSIRINMNTKAVSCLFRHGNSLGDVPDQVLSGHSTHDFTPTVDEHHPADSYSAGRMGSVSGNACDQSGCALHDGPACVDSQGLGIHELTDALVSRLPDPDLEQLNLGLRTKYLADLMSEIASVEIQRRIQLRKEASDTSPVQKNDEGDAS